jgi:lipid II:glycine glycyltransferase (peptidoglycan interpeptide bridge formation enzyme)
LNDNCTGSALWDIASPEFAGMFASGAGLMPTDDDMDGFSRFVAEQGIVSEFIHLHPWKARTDSLVAECIHFNREIVYVDLTLSERELWTSSFTHACRKNIKRSQRENVRIFDATSVSQIQEFHRIYMHTMDRRNALKQYHFPIDYFVAIFERMAGNARFVLAEHNNEVVAATLYLHDQDDIYSYLGGADERVQQIRPTNAIVYDTILWGKRLGKKRLILGAGYSTDDGIFRFKASFSSKRAKFCVYKRIHRLHEYETLCRNWSAIYQSKLETTGHFPAYRQSPELESRAIMEIATAQRAKEGG